MQKYMHLHPSAALQYHSNTWNHLFLVYCFCLMWLKNSWALSHIFYLFSSSQLVLAKLKVYRSCSIAEKQIKMPHLQEIISHLRIHAAQLQDDIMQHSSTIEELKQQLRAAKHGLMSIQEEDASVQLKKKQSRDQLCQLQTELQQCTYMHLHTFT